MTAPFSLAGKAAAVTGGLGLLGAAVVEALAASGACVLVLDRDDERWRAIRERFSAADPPVNYRNLDITQFDDAEAHLAVLEEDAGPQDVWVNCAFPRTADWDRRLEDIPVESWRRNVDMHLNAYCAWSNAVARRMARRGGGSIVNVASIYGVVAPDFGLYEGIEMTSPGAYSAIKGGIVAHSRYLASYYAEDAVRVNVICPGGILNEQPVVFRERYARKTLVGRLAEPAEVAWPIVFLASDAASYMTGVTLMVDGGLTAT